MVCRIIICLSIVLLACSGTAWSQAVDRSVVLSLPRGQELRIAVIPLGIGDEPFAAREFFLGGRGREGFREAPTRARLGGVLVRNLEGSPDWCVALAKTETTQAQWAAVMDLPEPEAGKAHLPITSVSVADILTFIERLNAYSVHGNPVGNLPEISNGRCYLRLPTEAEWEFAARGGDSVDSGVFDKRVAYADSLNRYEWFAGPGSSDGKLHPVASLEANPLGVHDMLGNCAEIVQGLYQIEYLHGRCGGYILRGGSIMTPESQIRSSLRSEVPVCMGDGQAYRSPVTGFRLALGSPVMPDIATTRMLEEAWEQYSSKRIQDQPSLPSTASLPAQTSLDVKEIDSMLDEITSTMHIDRADNESVEGKLSIIRSQVSGIQARVTKAEEYFATGAVRLASVASTQTCKALQRRRVYEELKDRSREIGIIDRNIAEAKATMEESCIMLAEITPEVSRKAFERHLQSLKSAGYDEQYKCTLAAKVMATAYVSSRQLDFDSWLAELRRIAGQASAN